MMENDKKNVMEFSVHTPFGRMTVLYDYSETIEAFKFDLREYVVSREIGGKEVPYAESWQLAFGYATETLIEIFPQVISDTLDQAYFEARGKALKELNEKPYFSDKRSKKDGEKISPMQILKNYNPKTFRKFCEEVADEAYKRSRQRLGITTKGGKDSKLRANYYAALEDYYERYSLQAKSILSFYKWKREHLDSKSNSKMNDSEWHKRFLETLDKDFSIGAETSADAEILKRKIADARNRTEKQRYKNLYESLKDIWAFPDEEVSNWKHTFHEILAEGYDQTGDITFAELKPEGLTYYLLSHIFNASPRTIKNNLKDLRREKKHFKKID